MHTSGPTMAIEKLAHSIIATLARRKPLHVSTTKNTYLDRCLSTLDLTFIGIGATFGGGVYIFTGELAKNKTGPAVILSFVIAGIAAVLSGLCYAEFGTRISKAGSAYVYSYVALGEFLAFLCGWNLMADYIVGISASTKGVSMQIDSLANGIIKNTTISITGQMHVVGLSDYFDFLSVLIVSIFSVILILGIKNSSRFNALLTAFNILVTLFATGVGFSHADAKNWSDFTPYGLSGIIRGATTCFFTFIGFDVIAVVGEEAKHPEKSIPLSILGTISVCFFMYFNFSAALTLLVPYTHLTYDVSKAFSQRNLLYMRYIIGTSATIALLGCTFMALIGPPRLLYAMSADGLLPSIFSKVNKHTKTPVIGSIVSGIVIALLAAILELDTLIDMLSLGTLLAFSFVDISVLVMRYQPQKNTGLVNESVNESLTSNNEEALKQDGDLWKQTLKSPVFPNMIIFGIVVGILGASILVGKCSDELFVEKSPGYLTCWIICIVCIMGNGIFLHFLPTYTEGLHFRVPCMPWIPIAGLIFNVTLLIELNSSTWLRYSVWIAIGLVVYFAFSVRHSVEAKTTYEALPSDVPDEENSLYEPEKIALIGAKNENHD